MSLEKVDSCHPAVFKGLLQSCCPRVENRQFLADHKNDSFVAQRRNLPTKIVLAVVPLLCAQTSAYSQCSFLNSSVLGSHFGCILKIQDSHNKIKFRTHAKFRTWHLKVSDPFRSSTNVSFFHKLPTISQF